MLRHFVSPSQDDWDLRLPCCEFAVNNAWNAATGNTPFFLNYGENPRSPVSADVICRLPAAKSFEGRVNEAIANARNFLAAAQARMKKNADLKRRELQFEVGMKVLLSTKNLKLAIAGAPEFKAKFIGPYEILQRVGTVAYKLKLPDTMSRIHPIFHVSLLKQYYEGGNKNVMPPPVIIDGQVQYFIEKLVDHHELKDGTREFLVEWKGCGPEQNLWVPEAELDETAALQDYLDSLQDFVKSARHAKSRADKRKPAPSRQGKRKRRK